MPGLWVSTQRRPVSIKGSVGGALSLLWIDAVCEELETSWQEFLVKSHANTMVWKRLWSSKQGHVMFPPTALFTIDAYGITEGMKILYELLKWCFLKFKRKKEKKRNKKEKQYNLSFLFLFLFLFFVFVFCLDDFISFLWVLQGMGNQKRNWR